MEPKYYLPISSKCLAHYFGSACIIPSKYLQNKPYDLQNKFEDFLLITNNIGTKDTDCCLELVLTKNELKELIIISKGFYLYQKPLAISRVKTILFSNRNQMEQTIANITMSTAFVPEKIIKIVSKFDNVDTSKFEKPSGINIKDWTLQIKKNNSFLGGFALMRLAGEEYMNYSENYFSTLSFFNETIKNELLIAGRNVDNRFWDAFIGNSNFKKIYPIINKSVDEFDLNEIAKEEGQIIEKDKITRIINLDKIEKNTTYIVAVLNTFGVGNEARKKKIDGLVLSNFKSEIKPEKSEGIALCFGLNKGYSIFPNKYKSGNKEKIVKFQLNSQLDYYTIESIFQFVFNDTRAESFPYLDNWCSKSFDKLSSKKKSDYKVLDVVIIGKKKPKVISPEYLASLLQRFFQKEGEGLLKDFLEKIRTTIYNDTIEELYDEVAIRDEEIIRLNNETAKVSKLETEVNRLINENQNIKIKDEEYLSHYQESAPIKNLVEEPISSAFGLDKKQIVKQVLHYKEMNKTMLEKEAKEKGISIRKGAKIDDIIVLLMNAPINITNSKLHFPE